MQYKWAIKMAHIAKNFIETDVSCYVHSSPTDNRKDTFVSSVIMNSVGSRFIHATLYFYCYVYVFLLLCMLCSVYSVFIVPTGTLRLP